MTKYELHRKNEYCNVLVAVFEEENDLIQFVSSNPITKGGYFYIEIEEIRTRHSINGW